MTLPTLAPQNMNEAMEFSKMIASSGLVPQQYKNKPQDVLVAVQWGYELGLQPLQALQNIAVINGKPSVYGDAALALVKNDSRCAGVHEYIDGDGDNRIAYCTAKRRYGDDIEETTRTFSVDDAKRAGLWGRKGPWTQYPDRMLMMRARGFTLRDAFPDALKGVITAEEAQDYPSKGKSTQTAIQEAPANPLDQLPKPEPKPGPEAKQEPEVVEVVDDYGEVVEKPKNIAQQKIAEIKKNLRDSKPKVYKLYHWNGDEAKEFKTLPEWADGFKNLMAKMADSKKFDAKKKTEMLIAMRSSNKEVIEDLGSIEQESVKDFYMTLIDKVK